MTGPFELPTRKFGAAWEGFWNAKGSSFNLGLFRILFAITLFLEVDISYNKNSFALEGGFHFPYVGFIQPVSEQAYEVIHQLQYPLILLLGLGLFTRLSIGTLFLLQGYIFFADRLNFRNHPYFFLLILFLLLFSPSDDALSLRSILRGWRERRPWIPLLLGTQKPLTFQRLIQIQVCIVYLWAALHKLNGGYLSGLVLNYYIRADFLTGFAGNILKAIFPDAFLIGIFHFFVNPATLMSLSFLSLIVEVALPFALWFPKTRPIALLVGFAFHLGLYFTLEISTFTLALIASYLLFFDPETLVARLRRLLRETGVLANEKGYWNLFSRIRRDRSDS